MLKQMKHVTPPHLVVLDVAAIQMTSEIYLNNCNNCNISFCLLILLTIYYATDIEAL